MKIIAGVDEVGRGSLIGPVYAAAVILKKFINKKLLKDSKKITKSKREILAKYIKKNSLWAIGKASVKEIEKINILNASLLAMKRAIVKLSKKPSLVLIDGNKLPEIKWTDALTLSLLRLGGFGTNLEIYNISIMCLTENKTWLKRC